MNRHYATLAILTSLVVGTASAETLLVDRVQQESTALPTRGMSTTQVQAKFGAPTDRLDPRGGQKRQWPTINRWSYPNFIVYFEKNTVIDAVVTAAASPVSLAPSVPTASVPAATAAAQQEMPVEPTPSATDPATAPDAIEVTPPAQ